MDCAEEAGRPTAVGSTTGAAPVIGRESETAQIDRFLDGLGDGSRTLLVEGEVGIGKTVMLHRAAERAGARGLRLLTARPLEAELPLEFAALADLLEPVPRSLVAGLPGPQRQAIDVAVLRREISPVTVDPRTIATAVLTVVRALAADGPVVLIVDDVPWLDLASARTLSFVLRRAGPAPVGLVAAARTEWLTRRPRTVVDDLDPDRVEHIRLGAMSPGAVRELLRTRSNLTADRTALLRLHRTSGGNPLLAMQLAAHPPPAGDVIAGDVLPAALHGLVDARLRALSAGERDAQAGGARAHSWWPHLRALQRCLSRAAGYTSDARRMARAAQRPSW